MSRVEDTRNLVVAKFRHETSREGDPQLHTHALVSNLTQRRDGAWRALHNDQIVKTTRYLGAVYRAELAAELQRAGYALRHGREGFFELAHEYSLLVRRDTTQAERTFAKNYAPGELIQPERDYPKVGLERGTLYEVVETGPGNRLTVRDERSPSSPGCSTPTTSS